MDNISDLVKNFNHISSPINTATAANLTVIVHQPVDGMAFAARNTPTAEKMIIAIRFHSYFIGYTLRRKKYSIAALTK